MDNQIFTVLKTAVWALHNAHPLGTAEGWRHHQWFTNVSPGDIVMETTTVWNNAKDSIRFGELLRVGQEFMHSDEEWEEIKDQYRDDPRPTHQVFRIRLLKDGSEMHWHDCSFIRVPKEMNIAADFHYVTRTGNIPNWHASS
jgi:hypothetical protein